MEILCSSSTDNGDIRSVNQDSVLCLQVQHTENHLSLFIVADGMGGLEYGGQVSSFIIARFEQWANDDLQQMLSAGRDSDEDIGELLEQEIWDINQSICQFREEAGCRAGSTLSLLLLYGTQYYIKNLGDSRIYLLRNRKLNRLTIDQSLAEQWIRENQTDKEHAKNAPGKNVLTMCIGMFKEPKSFSTNGKARPGDCFLLCSDGAYNHLKEEAVIDILNECELSTEDKVKKLRRQIPQGTATDNVSIIVVEIKKKNWSIF